MLTCGIPNLVLNGRPALDPPFEVEFDVVAVDPVEATTVLVDITADLVDVGADAIDFGLHTVRLPSLHRL